MGSVEIIREPAPEPVTVDRVVHQDSPETLAELERLRGIEREHARAALMSGLAKLEDAKAKVEYSSRAERISARWRDLRADQHAPASDLQGSAEHEGDGD